MKKSYWLLFSLAILSPTLVVLSFILKQKEIAAYKYFAYFSVLALVILMLLAFKELRTLLKSLKK